jgi:hypothetical protein
MNVEIGAEAAQFPEKEYINGIAFAVWDIIKCLCRGTVPLEVPYMGGRGSLKSFIVFN